MSTLPSEDPVPATRPPLLDLASPAPAPAAAPAPEDDDEEVQRHLSEESSVQRVVFAVRGSDAREAFERALASSERA